MYCRFTEFKLELYDTFRDGKVQMIGHTSITEEPRPASSLPQSLLIITADKKAIMSEVACADSPSLPGTEPNADRSRADVERKLFKIPSTHRLPVEYLDTCYETAAQLMGHNTPLIFRSGQRPFAHPLLPERRQDRLAAQAVIAPSPAPQKTYTGRKVTDNTQSARHSRDVLPDSNAWFWQTTRGAAISLYDLVRSSRLPWTGEKRVSATGSLEQASLLGETTRRAVEVMYPQSQQALFSKVFPQSLNTTIPASSCQQEESCRSKWLS